MKVVVKSPVEIEKASNDIEILAQKVIDLQIELDLLRGGKENA
ncbi:MAG: hypothetical protein N4A64_07050 [Marinisporobacter sp.]|nr:hypothetical protein [Marinisporobacter sp.]